MISVLVVDDEPLARQRLARLLERIPGYRSCGEASQGDEAVAQCRELNPDIVLLDIRMPGKDGLQAAEEIIGLDAPPAIIFCTAYDEYALPALKLQAVDYLLKPVRREDLQQALEKAGHLNRMQLNALQQDPPAPQKLSAKSHRGTEIIPLNEVLYFRADQKYVTVTHLQGETVIDGTLKDFEQTYSATFVRIHRNTLVNLDHIDSLYKDTEGHTLIRLRHSPVELQVSRRHIAEVKKRLQS